MTRDQASGKIRRELQRAEQALAEGIPSRARACARRAAGYALERWLERHPRPDWPREAFARLQLARSDPAFPPEIREAARLLTLTVRAEYDALDRVSPEERAFVLRRIQAINRKEHVPDEMDAVAVARVIVAWVERA